MPIYDIYIHKSLNYQIVKRGESWPAFLFTWAWALSKKLWTHAIVTFCIFLFLAIFSAAFPPIISGVTFLASFFALFLFGARGNDWWRTELLRQDFRHFTTIEAADYHAAVAQFAARETNHVSPDHHEIHDKSTRMVIERDNDWLLQLERLALLREKGALTEEEFQVEKNKILQESRG